MKFISMQHRWKAAPANFSETASRTPWTKNYFRGR